jgi:hypothetical protein
VTGPAGVVYSLHFDRPTGTPRHYTGKAGSSGFLKVQRTAVSWGFLPGAAMPRPGRGRAGRRPLPARLRFHLRGFRSQGAGYYQPPP